MAKTKTKRRKSKSGKAKKGKSKYNKIYIETWQCEDCDFKWSYQTMKCPLCYCVETTQIV